MGIGMAVVYQKEECEFQFEGISPVGMISPTPSIPCGYFGGLRRGRCPLCA